jgi:hypothetical protein
VVTDLLLTLLDYGGFVFCFCCFFLLVYGREIQLKKSSLGSSRLPVSSTVCIGRFLSVFSSDFEVKFTHIRQLLLDTCHPTAFIVFFHPFCRKYWLCGSLELSAWSSRTRESLLSDCAWRSRSAFFRPCLGAPKVYVVGSATGCFRCRRVCYTHRNYGEVCHFLHCQRLVFGFFCHCICVFLLFSWYSLFLYYFNFTEIFVG